VLKKYSNSSFSLFGIIKIKKPNGKKQIPKIHDKIFGIKEYEKFRNTSFLVLIKILTLVFCL